jgi:Tol biopolymer transport system component
MGLFKPAAEIDRQELDWGFSPPSARSHTTGDNFEPSWSPDGSKIAYQDDGAIFAVELGGGDIKKLTDRNNNDSSPAWNPRPPGATG